MKRYRWGQDMKPLIERVLHRLDKGQILDSEEAYIEAVNKEYPVG